jgi:hypothetical protein
VLRNQSDRGQNCRGDHGFDVHRAGLSANPLQLLSVGDGLGTLIHVAQTARCQPYSRLVSRLEDSESANIEKEDERQTPDERRLDGDQERRDDHARSERGDAEEEALTPFSDPDVGGSGCG